MTSYTEGYKDGVKYSTRLISMDKILEEVTPLAKIPIILMRFDVYARNNVLDVRNNVATSTNLNTDIRQKYITTKTGETNKVYDNLYISPQFTFSISLRSTDGDYNDDFFRNLSGEFEIFLKPTWDTLILVWLIFMVPLAHAFIVLSSSILRFILTGSPFTDIFNNDSSEK